MNTKPIETGEDRRRWYALLILSLSLMLVIIDGTIVNIAIPSIRKTFGTTIRDVEWVNSIYSLVYAATLILWGKIGDQYGRRLLFLIGVVMFGVGSVLVGASSSLGMLVAMRAFQGVGAAMLSPSTLSIITTTFKGKERGIAFGVWGATAGVAAALGPLLGGFVITHAGQWDVLHDITPDSWRWAFYINLPVVALAFVGSLWAIQESRDEGVSHHLDFVGTILGGLGLGAFVFGLIEGSTYGWWKTKATFKLFGWEWPFESFSIIPTTIIGGAILLAIFTWYELRQERSNGEPLFEFGLLKYRSFRFGMLTGLIVNLGEMGILFALSIFLQSAKGLSAFDTGVAFLPLAMTSLFAAPMAGMFSSKVGPKWIVSLGMSIEALALLWMSQIIKTSVSVNLLAIPLAVYGLGLGLAIAQLANLVLYDIPGAKSGIASGANSTIRQVGAALGIALIGTVLTTTIENSGEDGLRNSQLLSSPAFVGMRDGIIAQLNSPEGFDYSSMGESSTAAHPSGETMPAGMTGDATAGTMPTGNETQGAAMPEGTGASGVDQAMGDPSKEIGRIFKDAISDGAANSALVAFIFVGLGALSSLLLPNPKGVAAMGEQ